MVTGRVPFDGSTPSAVMHKHLKEPLTPPDHVNVDLSAGVGEIIEIMMAKPKDDRYSTTKELINDIEAVMAGEPPFQARKRYDQGLLHKIADSGVTVSTATADDIAPKPESTQNWTMVLAMGFLLTLSILINIVLLVTRK
jgi:hypothetical protein